MSRNSTIFVGLAVAAVTLAIAGYLLHNFWLIILFKPLATALIFALAASNVGKTKQAYALWISVGLLFSLAGDTFLILPDKFFLPGLAAFLLTHLSYLLAFTRDAKFPAHRVIWVVFLAIAAANILALKPNLPTTLAIPVVLYALVLSTMTAQALGRFILLRTSAAKLAAIGAVFFVFSDTLLGFDRFHTAIPFASVLILISYYAAQLLISLSTRPAGT